MLEGDIDTALELTNAYFPSVLSTNHEINFRLRCRKYIEMIRDSADLHAATPVFTSKSSRFPNGHSTTADGEQAMDLDEGPGEQQQQRDGDGDFDEKMEMSEPSATGRSIPYDEMIHRTIAYGRELHTEFNDEPDPKLRELFRETLKELFGLLAYKDPQTSPAAKWLEMGERAKVAEGLNSAILGMSLFSHRSHCDLRSYHLRLALHRARTDHPAVSLGKSSFTSLERMYKQTIVLTDLISEEGGPGSLINFRKLLKQ